MFLRWRKTWALWLPGILVPLLTGAATPDLNGAIWRPIDSRTELRQANGSPPPLLPEARKKYEENRAARRRGQTDFDPAERCVAPGVPRLLLQNMPFEFLQRDERIFIHYQWNRLVRVIDMNIAQPEPYGPLLLGQSVGRWDGGTLVIDTISLDDRTLLDDAGMPHSDALHVIERYRLMNEGRTLQLALTIDDPKTFSKSWEARLRFRRDAGDRIEEDVCVERKGVVFWKGDKS